MLIKLVKKKNYLAMIENAAKGENWMFRNFYVEIDGKEIDILKNGSLSCAVFASSILYLHKLIKDIHANIRSLEKDMIKNGWFSRSLASGNSERSKASLRPGAVLVWEEIMAKDEPRPIPHIGFYVGNEMAISNDSKGTGFPWKHHYTYNDTRKIEKIYWHSALNKDS